MPFLMFLNLHGISVLTNEPLLLHLRLRIRISHEAFANCVEIIKQQNMEEMAYY